MFKLMLFVMALDLLLNLTWFPIGVARTYGFRSAHEAFLVTSKIALLRCFRTSFRRT